MRPRGERRHAKRRESSPTSGAAASDRRSMRELAQTATERAQTHARTQGSAEHCSEGEHSERAADRARRSGSGPTIESPLAPSGSAECGCVHSPLLRKVSYVVERWLLLDWLFVLFVAVLVGLVDQIEPWHKPLSELQLADVNINLPYLPSIISDKLVICLSMLMPPMMMLLLVFPCRRHHRGSRSELRVALLAFFTAVFFNLLVTTVTKKYIGRPRPNFVAYTGYFNQTYLFAHNKRDAFQSFPSGHASVSFAGLGFLSMWLYTNLVLAWRIGSQPVSIISAAMGSTRREAHRAQRNQLPLLGLITLPLWLALYIALTRVRDHHHNSEDVLAGSVLGLAIAWWSYRAIYLGRAVEWGPRDNQAQAEAAPQRRRSSSSSRSSRRRLLSRASSSAVDSAEPSSAAIEPEEDKEEEEDPAAASDASAT